LICPGTTDNVAFQIDTNGSRYNEFGHLSTLFDKLEFSGATVQIHTSLLTVICMIYHTAPGGTNTKEIRRCGTMALMDSASVVKQLPTKDALSFLPLIDLEVEHGQ